MPTDEMVEDARVDALVEELKVKKGEEEKWIGGSMGVWMWERRKRGRRWVLVVLASLVV